LSVLDRIRTAGDVKTLSLEERVLLAEEVRATIIDVIRRNGGHLASSLGVVELTIALLSVFTPPGDILIWDVGHQAYPYKLLTGRSPGFSTIRTAGGISGFPKRSESPCDAFGTGHSSTAISAALGFALARDASGSKGRVVAVVGDGAMTGGMALEGLNNLGHSRTDMTIILNDNEMSISKNVGAIPRHLTRLITDPTYNRMRNDLWNLLGRFPSVGERMRRAGHLAGAILKKSLVSGSTVFDDFGVRYIGPVPGHDLPTLTAIIERVSRLRGPVLIHVVTIKGKGYEPAECDATSWHGIPGECPAPSTGESFTSAFSRTILELGEADPGITAITAAMADGTGLTAFSKRFPERFYDVGIAEQHAVTFACALAFGGMKPVVALYSTFLQRALDQVIHDAALQCAPIVLAIDRAGAVGEDGPTHHGIFDIAMLRSVPNLLLAAPRNCAMLSALLRVAFSLGTGPVVIRYPRGSEPGGLPGPGDDLRPGRGQVLRDGPDVLVIACGVMAGAAMEAAGLLAAEGVGVCVFDPVWLKPAPWDAIESLAAERRGVVVVEDGSAAGGFGEGVALRLAAAGTPVRALGYPDMFQPQGPREGLLAGAGLDADGIAGAVRGILA
jgi:1-deoxy-D-xylulose-5-phosphate synthase